MALSADFDRPVRGDPGRIQTYPAGASDIFYKGAILALNTSGNAIVAADTANLVFAGICVEQVDNSSGAAGALNVKVYTGGTWRITLTGAAQTDVALRAMMSDDDTVEQAGDVTNDRPIGLVVAFETNLAWVNIDGYASTANASDT